MIEGKIVRVAMLNYFYQLIRDIFVLQETGKGLSTNDYTTDEKTAVAKIADIETDLANKVDGEVYDESGYVTGVSFKKGSYAISMGTNAGDPRISIKNDTTVNFDLAQTSDITIKSVKVNGTALTPDSYKAVDVDVPVFSGYGTGQPGMGTEECVNVKIANRGDSDYIAINFTDNGLNLTGSIYDDGIAGGTNCASTRIIPDETRVSALIAAELADISGVDFVVVAANEELPETGVKGKFYLKDTGATGSNKYDEYVWVNHGTAEEPNYGYEKLGTMDVDLTGYIKESDIQFATKADIDAIFGTNSGE